MEFNQLIDKTIKEIQKEGFLKGKYPSFYFEGSLDDLKKDDIFREWKKESKMLNFYRLDRNYSKKWIIREIGDELDVISIDYLLEDPDPIL